MTESPDAERGPLLDRREVIRRVSACLGGMALIGGQRLCAAVERVSAGEMQPSGARVGEFTAEQIALLDEIAETILPATHTPGAKAANTGAFMAFMVTDAYGPEERRVFIDGMHEVDAAMRKANRVSFLDAAPAQRLALLTVLDIEQKRVMDQREQAARGRSPAPKAGAAPYFRMMKELAMLGFFTSKVGCTQVLRYVESPGRYDPCLPHVAGEPAWALHA